MTGTVWIPGAERLAVSAPGGDITSTAPPRVVWHTTEAPSGVAAEWAEMQRVLRSKGAEPQVLYDPLTDRLGQFMGLDVSGRALQNDGTTRTNRVGVVCIQVEVIAYAARPFTDYWTPGANFKALMAAIRSWGITDIWPAGPPPRYVNGVGNIPASPRDRNTWLTQGGHYSHAQIPGNSHGDPGGINVAKLFAAAPRSAPTPPKVDDVALTPDQEADINKAGWLADQFKADGALMAKINKAAWLADQFGQTGQFQDQLDRIEELLKTVQPKS